METTIKQAQSIDPSFDLTPSQIDRLSRDEFYDVRAVIAQRPDLTPSQIGRLCNDSDWYVRKSIAEREG